MPHCGGVRYDDGHYCPECQRDDQGRTLDENLADYWAKRAEETGSEDDRRKARYYHIVAGRATHEEQMAYLKGVLQA